jgi:hypothetical protein
VGVPPPAGLAAAAEELAGRLLAGYRLARALNRRLESADLRALDVPIQELLSEHAATTVPGLSPGHPIVGPLASLSSADLGAAFTEISPGITVTRSAALAWWLIVDWNASAGSSNGQFLSNIAATV